MLDPSPDGLAQIQPFLASKFGILSRSSRVRCVATQRNSIGRIRRSAAHTPPLGWMCSLFRLGKADQLCGGLMCRNMPIIVILFAQALLLSGCVVTDIGVSNPLPDVRRVAVAPFINLTTEPDVDLERGIVSSGGYVDRRFAKAYFAELQKTPGFEVIPVGVVEQAIAASGRSMNGPEDYLAVAHMIGADAIVVGAVTDFDPYHPRLGMQVQWYSEYAMLPPAPTMPFEREWDEENYRIPEECDEEEGSRLRGRKCRGKHAAGEDCQECVVRAQSPGNPPTSARPSPAWVPPLPGPKASADEMRNSNLFALPGQMPLPGDQYMTSNASAETELPPLYSYTRFFDGRDARLTARLRDYVELSGDLRSGGWESYLDRSDDFIRFSCHLMISEMLMLHGGESSRRTVFKYRRELSRKL